MQLTQNQELALQQWLERRLVSISDAEAPILAEYCLALLKHNGGPDQVRALCIEQLRDFLKNSTEPFVDEIFATLESGSYLIGAPTQRAFQSNSDETAPSPAGSTVSPENTGRPATDFQSAEYYQQVIGNPLMLAACLAAFAGPPPRQPCRQFEVFGRCERGSRCTKSHDIRSESQERRDRSATKTGRHSGERTQRALPGQRMPKANVDQSEIDRRQELHRARAARKRDMAATLQELEEQKRQLLQQQAKQQALIAQLESQAGANDSRSALQIQLDSLKSKALSLGIDPAMPPDRAAHRPARPSFKARANTPYSRPMTLDLRPKAILISGVLTDKDHETLRAHLLCHKAVESSTDSIGEFVAHFRTRHAAERFIAQGPPERCRHLHFSWFLGARSH